MPNQKAGLNYDHGMCRAVLHANPGSAAHSPLASAASSDATKGGEEIRRREGSALTS